MGICLLYEVLFFGCELAFYDKKDIEKYWQFCPSVFLSLAPALYMFLGKMNDLVQMPDM